MARINLSDVTESEKIEMPDDVQQVADIWASNKVEADAYDALCKKLGDKLKAVMLEANSTKISTPYGTVSRIEAEKVSFDEARLLEVVKAHNLNMVKTVEVVDMDALESYIYHGDVPADVAADLDACKKTQVVVQLRLTKSKKGGSK